MKAYPESRLTDLLIEFDEMGFCPTTVCPHPEQYAIEWKEQIVKEIQKLQAENTELRATLSKMETVEKELRARFENHDLPIKVWDAIYCIRNWGTGRYKVEEHTVTEIVFEYDNRMRIKTPDGIFGYEKWIFGVDCFADKSEAEARLKELQGGER